MHSGRGVLLGGEESEVEGELKWVDEGDLVDRELEEEQVERGL